MTRSRGAYTEFAASERSDAGAIRRHGRHLADVPLLGTLLDAVPSPVMVLNRQRQIVFANRKMLEVVGLADLDAVLGLRPGEALRCVHARRTAGGCGTSEFCRTCGAVKAILGSQLGETQVQECQALREPPEGAMDLRVQASPIKLGDQTFTLFVVNDISHEKRRRALEAIFFHDILNTAAALQGLAGLLDRAPSRREQLSEAIRTAAAQLIEGIRAQRDLAAAESGELKAQPSQVRPAQLLSEVAESYRLHPLARGRGIRCEPCPQEASFVSDPVLLSRVLGNMIKNALEAAEPGEAVTLGCQVADHEVVFRVHNPGVIPADVQLQIFQRSFSTKGVGRGLGTYSMKLLSERFLGGSVSFTSVPGSGTTFVASFPVSAWDQT